MRQFPYNFEMEIGEERIGEVTVLSVVGEFDARTAPQAHAKLDGLMEHLRTRLVFNVSGLEIVTSTAISFLLDAAKRTRKFGGDAVLTEAPQLLMKSLRSLDVGDYFQTFDSDDAALAHFKRFAEEAESSASAADGREEKQRPWWRLGR